jgi:hypothetical protein
MIIKNANNEGSFINKFTNGSFILSTILNTLYRMSNMYFHLGHFLSVLFQKKNI